MFLVTGGAGFIGSHTVRALLAAGHRVRVLDDLSTGHRELLHGLDAELVVGSVADEALVDEVMEGVDHVVHLAACPSAAGSCDEPVPYDTVNVHGAVVVFETARRHGVRRAVYASSAACYGSSEELPKREDQPVLAESPYAAAKAANELYGAVYSRTLGLETVGLRFFNVFGPGQDPDGPYAAVVPKFVERAVRGEPLWIFGDGEQSRDFVSVHDVTRAIRMAASTPGVGGRVYNVGTGRGTTVNRLARYVLDVVGVDVGVEHHPPRTGDVRHSRADISRIREDLGWEPTADFDAAMAETVAWYRDYLSERTHPRSMASSVSTVAPSE